MLALTLAGLVLAQWAEANQATRRTESTRVPGRSDALLGEAKRARADAERLLRAADWSGAIERAGRSVAILEELDRDDDRELCGSLAVLAAALDATGAFERAESLYRRALRIWIAALSERDLDVAALQNDLARTLGHLGVFAEADRIAREALATREAALGPDHPLVADSLATLASIAFDRNDASEAVSLAQRALAVASKTWTEDTLPYQWFATRLARAEVRQGEYARSGERIELSRRIREAQSGPESVDVADSISALAFLYLQKRDNVRATEETRRALELEQKIFGPGHPRIADLETSLGLLAYRARDYSDAKAHFARALSILDASVGGNHYSAARVHNNLGLVLWREGDRDEARTEYERALAIAEASFGPESTQIAPALANLGIITKESGDYAAAEGYYKRSVALMEANVGPNHPQLVAPLESLGILYRDRGDHALAEPYFLRVLAISERALGSDHPEVARHFDNLYHLYAAWGQPGKSLEALERRLAIDERNLPLQLAVGSERQKLAYFKPFLGGIDDAVWFDLRHGDADPRARELAATTILRRKGRVLEVMANGLAALRERSREDDRARLDALADVTARLAGLVLNGPRGGSVDDHQAKIAALSAERDAIEGELSRRVAGWVERADATSLGAVRAAIPEGAALLEMAVYRPFDPHAPLESDALYGNPRYAVYVVGREAEVRALDLGAADEIDALVDAFRRALHDPKRDDALAAGRALDARVMEPVRALLGATTRLLISPDGQLHLIPFEALVDERGRFLVERFEISYLNSGRELLRMNASRPSRAETLIVANPLFGDPDEGRRVAAGRSATALRGITTGEDLASVYFAPLAGTAVEARSIKALFPDAEVLTRAAATEAAIRTAAAPRILHVATHGFLLGDPDASKAGNDGVTRAVRAKSTIENPLLRSGLALAGANLAGEAADDGILTALEASSLDLRGTKLVTLSACDTGIGEVKNGDGVYGLRRAFFMAGAETLVMSLWPVSDSVTQKMMTSYYAGLKEGLGRGEALRRAELAMLARSGHRHPFYWASFIQLGNWGPLGGTPPRNPSP